mmetsp:Transcript_43302/g.116412  ORF Transcript_43302/g.116412 Transcript_43302/m.116412 type:complete len:210 (+) Transcript_43302:159-788(+)
MTKVGGHVQKQTLASQTCFTNSLTNNSPTEYMIETVTDMVCDGGIESHMGGHFPIPRPAHRDVVQTRLWAHGSVSAKKAGSNKGDTDLRNRNRESQGQPGAPHEPTCPGRALAVDWGPDYKARCGASSADVGEGFGEIMARRASRVRARRKRMTENLAAQANITSLSRRCRRTETDRNPLLLVQSSRCLRKLWSTMRRSTPSTRTCAQP